MDMVDVNVTISGIIMCCDESVCNVNLGRGYTIEKCPLDELPFKNAIMDGRNNLSIDYLTSRIIEDGKIYFICLKKMDTIQIEEPHPHLSADGTYRMSNIDCMCEDQLKPYMDGETQYLNEQINLLRIFKAGNIGFRGIFFNYKFTIGGFISNSVNHTSYYQTRNTLANERFTLSVPETALCNQWLCDYRNEPYTLLKNSIHEFSWGLEQVDLATGFEQYTTALEMTLLPQNQQGKKQMLANRVSALLGGTSQEIQQVHQKMLNFYRFRSESLHDGNGSNITDTELKELENVTREVLKKCIERCKAEYQSNHTITWAEVKNLIMSDLVTQVTLLKNSGALPT